MRRCSADRRHRTPPAACRPFDRGRVRDAPVGGHGLARPDRADLACRVVADGEDEIIAGAPGAANSSQLFERRPSVG